MFKVGDKIISSKGTVNHIIYVDEKIIRIRNHLLNGGMDHNIDTVTRMVSPDYKSHSGVKFTHVPADYFEEDIFNV